MLRTTTMLKEYLNAVFSWYVHILFKYVYQCEVTFYLKRWMLRLWVGIIIHCKYVTKI